MFDNLETPPLKNFKIHMVKLPKLGLGPSFPHNFIPQTTPHPPGKFSESAHVLEWFGITLC